ncbi:MAG: tetratricopeptide repeat protein, partial [Casimicrobiaceae bacterium]
MNAFAGVGRNASCPCGSGLKFKHCHGLAAFGTSLPANTSASAAAPAEPRQLLLEGMALQRRGDTAQARTIYERVLALDPDHPDAWHLLALLDASDGRAEDAVAKVRRAIATLPDHPPFHITLARALLRAGC